LAIGFVAGFCFALPAFIPKIKTVLRKYPVIAYGLAISAFILAFTVLAWLGAYFTTLDCFEGGEYYCGIYIGDNTDLDVRIPATQFSQLIIPPALRSQVCFTADSQACNVVNTMLENSPSWSAWELYILIIVSSVFAAFTNNLLIRRITRDKYKRSA
jgi:hypothetical protein